jgi:hypothetical protein
LEVEIQVNMSNGYIDLLIMVHELREIAATLTSEIKKAEPFLTQPFLEVLLSRSFNLFLQFLDWGFGELSANNTWLHGSVEHIGVFTH